MPCERDMKYVDQLPNGYVFVEEGASIPDKVILASTGRNILEWGPCDLRTEDRYNPRRHKHIAHAPVKKRSEW